MAAIGAIYLFPALLFCLPKSLMPRYGLAPRAALRRVWFAVRVILLTFAMSNVPEPINGLVHNPRYLIDDPTSGLANVIMIPVTFFILAISTSRNRGRIHRFLGQLGSNGSAEQEAAAVAALLGGGGAAEALAEGVRRFHALPLAELTEEDLKSNKDTGLYKRAVPATYGDVDCFVTQYVRRSAQAPQMRGPAPPS